MRPLVKTLAIPLIAAAFAAQPVMVLAADAPAPAGLQKVSEDSKDGGTHTYYRGTSSAAEIVDAYKAELESDGWSIVTSGGGGSSWGGGAGLTATRGSAYLVMEAGGESGETNVNLCVWPSKPDDDNCG